MSYKVHTSTTVHLHALLYTYLPTLKASKPAIPKGSNADRPDGLNPPPPPAYVYMTECVWVQRLLHCASINLLKRSDHRWVLRKPQKDRWPVKLSRTHYLFPQMGRSEVFCPLSPLPLPLPLHPLRLLPGGSWC